MALFGTERRIPKNREERVLFDLMHDITPDMLSKSLNGVMEKSTDPSVGIYVSKLPLDAVLFNGQMYEFYGARVLPTAKNGKQPYVTPHLHNHGIEPYYFPTDGTGEMNLGSATFDEDGQNGEVFWDKPFKVRRGDEVVVAEGQVHSFLNPTNQPFDFAFMCPPEHLVDHNGEHVEGDRYIVKNFKDGIPKHFPKN